jgi:hypothetical protein
MYLKPSDAIQPTTVVSIPMCGAIALPAMLYLPKSPGRSATLFALLLGSFRLSSWQVRTTARIALLGPPAASLVILVVDYFEYFRAVPFNILDFLVAFLLFALPVGYVFGVIPTLLAGALYCAALTADSRLLRRSLFSRACAAGICGGFASWLWFVDWLGIDSRVFELAGALVMAALTPVSPSRGEAPRERCARQLGAAVRER